MKLLKNNYLKYTSILVFIWFYSCTLDGVKTNENSNNDDLSDTIAKIDTTETRPLLLKDTLENGILNPMVFNGEKGLRIEWEIKNEKNPILLHDVVMVNYTAKVARGDVYDSNNEIGRPVPLKTGIGLLIDGWEMGLLNMSVGDKGKILIPSKLAYGEVGYEGIIPENADIVIDIEIVEKIEPIVLEGGVKVYIYETENKGKPAIKNQWITFNYFAFRTGNKPKMYDNSYEKGEPFRMRFENDNLIDGLHIGMSVLKKGDKAYIEVPSKYAYGSKGMLDLVPKNTDVVYDVRIELIE